MRNCGKNFHKRTDVLLLTTSIIYLHLLESKLEVLILFVDFGDAKGSHDFLQSNRFQSAQHDVEHKGRAGDDQVQHDESFRMKIEQIANQQRGERGESIRCQGHKGDQTVAHADALLHKRYEERMQRRETETDENDSGVRSFH